VTAWIRSFRMNGESSASVTLVFVSCIAVLMAFSSGCSTVADSAASGVADNLSAAILNQNDPVLVREAMPSYLLLLDSLAEGSPDNVNVLGAAAQLYAAYGVAFVEDEERAQLLTARARDYGSRALCAEESDACNLEGKPFDEYQAAILEVDSGGAEALYSYCIGSLAYIRTHSGDFVALADLPKIEFALNHLLVLNPEDRLASVNLYLGVLNSLRPPALGGEPERARAYFEKADELSGGADLSVKVEYARGYARLVYDRELHDQLLNEVIASDADQPGLTLSNSLAKQQAADLLVSADDYF
jgi:hypothetical protein